MKVIIGFIIAILLLLFLMSTSESFYLEPNTLRTGDDWQLPGAIVDTRFETDLKDYEMGY